MGNREIKYKEKDGKITTITPPEGARLFTGLKDKNGKEICEGDVVKVVWDNCQCSMGNIVWEQVVVWEKAWFALKDVVPTIKTDPTPMRDITAQPCPIHGKKEMLKDSYEVIGNIYENPELVDHVK